MTNRVFAILAISIFSSMLGAGIIAPLLPLYAENLGATAVWVGIIFAAFSISRGIFMPIFGRLSDLKGRKNFICFGLFSYAVISLGYVWTNTVFELTAIRLVHGVVAAMIIPIAQAYVGDLSPVGEEGIFMGYFNAAFFTGFALGPLLGGMLTEYFSMSLAFYVMGALNFLAFLLALAYLPEISNKTQREASSRISFREIARSGVVRGLFSFRLAYALGRGGFSCFLPIFAAFTLKLNLGEIGIVLAANMLAMSLPQMFFGRIANRFDRRGLVVIGSLLGIAFLALVPWMQCFWQLLALSIFGGIGGALSMLAASVLVVEEGRTYGMGSTLSVFNMAMSLGMAAGPLLGGIIVSVLDTTSVFYFAAALGLLGIGLFVWFTK